MKKAKTIFKIIFILFVLFIILNIIPILSFKKYINKNPAIFNYVKGIYHIHSTYSDGKGDLEDIVNAVKTTDLDFLILTDHGNPNLKSSESTLWKDDILVIGGSEVSLNEGHLAIMGYNMNSYKYPPNAQNTINDIKAEGGVNFIAHPFEKKIPWTDWKVTGFTGLEILSLYSAAKNKGPLLLFSFPVQYLINQDYALINLLKYPQKNVDLWDSFNNKNNHYYGIYALDAHAKLELSDKITINYPSYDALFRILAMYVNIKDKLSKNAHLSSRHIINSLKAGNFFNVIEALAPANGFEAHFLTSDQKFVPMGGEYKLTTSGMLRIKLPFNFATNFRVLQNSKVFFRKDNNLTQEINIPIHEPGNYRIEVFISRSKFKKLPWIMTNPFFIKSPNSKEDLSKPPNLKKYPRKVPLFNPESIKKIGIEKNLSSIVTFSSDVNQDDILELKLKYHLKKDSNQKDFWVAMACRNKFDFSKYQGISFLARSSLKMRYWIELRTKSNDMDHWFHISFLAKNNWREYNISFDKFYNFKNLKENINPSDIYALFFSLNNRLNYDNTSGELSIKNICLIEKK